MAKSKHKSPFRKPAAPKKGEDTSAKALREEGLVPPPPTLPEDLAQIADTVPATSQAIDLTLSTHANARDYLPPLNPGLALLEKKRRLQILTVAHDRAMRSAVEKDLWLFVWEALYATADQRKHYDEQIHGEICAELQNLQTGQNLGLVLPRASRKTFLCLAWCIWLMTCDPDVRIKCVTKNIERAKKLVKFVRNAFSASHVRNFPKFQALYPSLIITSPRQLGDAQSFTLPARTSNLLDPTFFGVHLGSTGAGSRSDIWWGDDPWDAQTLTTPEQGVKVYQQFLAQAPTVEFGTHAKHKKMVLSVTPWRYYDPTAILLGYTSEGKIQIDEKEKPVFNFYIRHGLENPDKLCTRCPPHVVAKYPHGEPDFPKGNPLLPTIFPREEYVREHQFFMTQPGLGEQSFFLQYMTVYQTQGEKKFQKEWFRRYPEPTFAAPVKRVLTLDDASKDFQQIGVGDYSVAKFGEFNEHGVLLKVHAIRSNDYTKDQFIDAMIAWCQLSRWFPNIVVKEKVGTDPFLSDFAKEYRKKIGRPIVPVVFPRTGQGRKHDFILSTLQAPYERGEILYGSAYPAELFERDQYELLNLGSSTHDDMADADTLFFVEGVRVVYVPSHFDEPRLDQTIQGIDLGAFGHPHRQGPSTPLARDPIDDLAESASLHQDLRRMGYNADDVHWEKRKDQIRMTPDV